MAAHVKEEVAKMNSEDNEADVEDNKPESKEAGAVDQKRESAVDQKRESAVDEEQQSGGDEDKSTVQRTVLAMLESGLGKLAGHSSGYIENLPKPVKRRIRALKKLQFESSKLEARFYQEVHSLECKYSTLYAPFFEKRYHFTTGKTEPTEEECDFPSECETEEEETADDIKKEDAGDEVVIKEEPVLTDDAKGIPEFWLTTFKNVAMISDMIQDHDEPVLKHLTDVILKLNPANPMGFTLEFHFEPNEFFTNLMLTKEYEMKCEPDEKDPFSFDGPEIVKCKGCSVDWKKGKNVTVKTIKKKQKHKSKGSVRTVTRTVQNDSFFNFFNPPAIPSPGAAVDSETEALLNADFEIGHFLKDRVIPRAVLYFTGEALTDYEDEEDEDEEDDDDKAPGDDSDPDFEGTCDFEVHGFPVRFYPHIRALLERFTYKK